uniref:Uncharacterized protein n=1 Tax=Amphimedon queenslandica TaxID=400682 RepID=A0A1X7SKM9_AMPQE
MKLPLIALCLLSFILINAVEANYRKKYCGSKEYVIRGDKYPHLHCGKRFFTLSYKGGKKHIQFVGNKGAVCSAVNKVLGSPEQYDNFNRIPSIADAIIKFDNYECQKLFEERDKDEGLLQEEDPTFEELDQGPIAREQSPGPIAEESVYDFNKNRMDKKHKTEDDEEEVENNNEMKPHWKQEKGYHQDDDDDDDDAQEWREEEYRDDKEQPGWN